MSKLTKKQRHQLQLALDALDTSSPNHSSTDYIRAHLDDSRLSLYLRSWVIPMIENVLGDGK